MKETTKKILWECVQKCIKAIFPIVCTTLGALIAGHASGDSSVGVAVGASVGTALYFS